MLALLGLRRRSLRCSADPHASPRPSDRRQSSPSSIAANPLAAQAGLNVLKRGGSAVDAAIAVQAMLSLVEPQSSGVGGGAFMTYLEARTGKVTVYDGREVAPAQAASTMFLDANGKPLPFNTAVVSGRATGVSRGGGDARPGARRAWQAAWT